jgi:hypothetical protein
VTSAVTWAAESVPHAVLAAVGLGVAAAAVLLVARSVRRARNRAAELRKEAIAAGETPAESMDPFTVYVTLMAMFLSIDGMWHVFGETMHLPWIVRLVACTVLESSGLAFMRLARKDILSNRAATRHVSIVWAIAALSGGLSASASRSVLEAVIRLALPPLSVQLCHSWMLPLPTAITLTQHEKGKRAWRYVKATRRLDRADNILTIWIAHKRLNLESDRLTKRSLMTGDATAVLAAAERIAITEALGGLGMSPGTVLDAAEGSGVAHADSRDSTDSGPRTPAALIDGLTSADPRTLAAVINGLIEADSAPDALALGPGSGESEPSADPESGVADPEPELGAQQLAVPVTVPNPMPIKSGSEPVALGFVPQQRDNTLIAGSGLPAWLQQSAAPLPLLPSTLAEPGEGPWSAAESGSAGPVSDSSDPAISDLPTLGSEINGLFLAPDSEPESSDPQERSEGPDPADASDPDPGPAPEVESEADFAALPWPAETSRIARGLVAEWRANARPFTRAELLTEVRGRRGSVSNKDRAAFWAWAIAPDIPSPEDELELVGAADVH